MKDTAELTNEIKNSKNILDYMERNREEIASEYTFRVFKRLAYEKGQQDFRCNKKI